MPWASMAPARSGAGRAAPELLTTPATELPDLPVLLTVLDGRRGPVQDALLSSERR
ncbi:hypothetical protein [Streptomyces lavendulae]|uniref:hypothetical protein n=1 Tax=Streptomyces lavendulae TaxID=1914 RepID=UPI0033F04E85